MQFEALRFWGVTFLCISMKVVNTIEPPGIVVGLNKRLRIRYHYTSFTFQHGSDTCTLPLNSLAVFGIRRESIILTVRGVSCTVQW